jgi:hypothetical protein
MSTLENGVTDKHCPNCGSPKGKKVLCPICHSWGSLYPFEMGCCLLGLISALLVSGICVLILLVVANSNG